MVHDALEIIGLLFFKTCSFTPNTTVSIESSIGGTDKITLEAPLFI